jgi:hypothetical protein
MGVCGQVVQSELARQRRLSAHKQGQGLDLIPIVGGETGECLGHPWNLLR